jgi:hypothetical protein
MLPQMPSLLTLFFPRMSSRRLVVHLLCKNLETVWNSFGGPVSLRMKIPSRNWLGCALHTLKSSPPGRLHLTTSCSPLPCSVLFLLLTLRLSSLFAKNLASPRKMCLVLSRPSGPTVLLARMPLVPLCLDLLDLTTTTTTTRNRTRTMVNVMDRERSNNVKVKVIKTANGATSTSPTCMISRSAVLPLRCLAPKPTLLLPLLATLLHLSCLLSLLPLVKLLLHLL